ncbi:hypothetical protein Bca101_086324 [Brassica carinata]
MDATNNLSEEFMIGSGGSGQIYKAELENGETVAAKKILWKDDLMSNKSFSRESEGLNLLIYEYMENGSVWDWFHDEKPEVEKKKKVLDWEARLRIAVGLAQGVEYLHHDRVPPILHRDIKSSNVLLDSNMEAHLGDFEYAYSLKATEKSDVYSMGIVLMEIVSGKMPTESVFGAEMTMVRWVETHLEITGSAREKLIDPKLKPLMSFKEEEAYKVLEIALQCTKTSPQERPYSRQACDILYVFNNRTAVYKKM